jgi:16S rRNA (adenine1518-N6/adenine1519-N6)-dimethyltransferase
MTTDPLSLRQLLRQHGLHPKKGLGQHFLADPVHLDRIVAAAELTSDDVVLEIGPGVGTLTERLAARAGHVIAVELDEQLLPVLQEVLAGHANVTILRGDILKLDPGQLVADTVTGSQPRQPADTSASFTIHSSQFTIHNYKVVANLPYYITSAAIRHLLTASHPPQLLVLTVQREVGQRMIAKPPHMSLLAVSVQFYAQPEIVARIPAGAFYPPPQVHSAIVRLRVRGHPAVEVPDEATFFQVVRAGFSQRRKQLRNSLRGGLGLSTEQVEALLAAAELARQRRAETLTLEEWGRLAWARSEQRG